MLPELLEFVTFLFYNSSITVSPDRFGERVNMAKVYGDEGGAKEQWNKLKDEKLSKKIEWIWSYYKTGILFGIGGAVVLALVIIAVVKNSVPKVITGEFFIPTAIQTDEEKDVLKDQLCSDLGLDSSKYTISLDITVINDVNTDQLVTQIQKTAAEVAAKSLDFIVGAQGSFLSFMDPSDKGSCALGDLSEILPEDLFEKLDSEGRILYYTTDFAGEMPFIIDIKGTELYTLLGLYSDTAYIGIPVTAPRTDAVLDLLSYIR